MLFVAVSHYPYYMPYVNSLSFGRPTYTLMSDSNVDWNQSLPAVAQFAQQRGIQKLKIDEYAFTESSAVVPGSKLGTASIQPLKMPGVGSWFPPT